MIPLDWQVALELLSQASDGEDTNKASTEANSGSTSVKSSFDGFSLSCRLMQEGSSGKGVQDVGLLGQHVHLHELRFAKFFTVLQEALIVQILVKLSSLSHHHTASRSPIIGCVSEFSLHKALIPGSSKLVLAFVTELPESSAEAF